MTEYCKPIDRTLGVGQLFKANYFWLIEVIGFWIKKKDKYNKTLRIFSSKNKSFHNLQKVSKRTVLNKIYLTKATSRNLSIKILSKLRVLIYRLDMHNLHTKTVSFPDQQKFLKEALFSLAVSLNANTENSQIKHCPCPKYLAIYRLDLYSLPARKNIWKLTKS